MRTVPDLSAVLEGLYDKPLLGPKPDQLLIFKRPQLAVKLEALMQPATTAAAKHANGTLINQVIAALYQDDELHDHVVGWAPVRAGQQNAEVHLCFKDASAQHRQQLAAAGSIQLTMHGAMEAVTLPVSTVASRQLPDVTMVRLHNVPGGMNVHGLMDSLLQHFQFGSEYSVVAEYGGDVSGDIAAVTPTWCRSDVCVAELRAPVHDPKLARLPAAFTCFGQQVSVSVQPSILAKAHAYRQRTQQQCAPQPQVVSLSAPVSSPRHKRRKAQRARAQRAAAMSAEQSAQPVQRPFQPLHDSFQPATCSDALPEPARVVLQRPLDPVSDLGGQHDKSGLGHSAAVPMQLERTQPPLHQASAAQPDDVAPAPSQSIVDVGMQQAAPPPLPPLPEGFPDSPMVTAIFLWAEEHDLSALHARQAILHLHERHAQELAHYASGSHISLPEPIQDLLISAVRSLTGDASFASYLTQLEATAKPASAPASASASAKAANTQPAAPRRTGRVRQPVSDYWVTAPSAPGGAQ